MSGPLIRPAAPRDVQTIAALVVASWRAAYRGLVDDRVLDDLSVAERTVRWRARLGATETSTTVAEIGGAVVGVCSTSAPSPDDDATPGVAELSVLYVRPDRWREGIGRALLRQALDDLSTRGWRTVTSWVLAANEPALAFYRDLGFEPDGAEGTHARSGRAIVRVRISLGVCR